MARQVPSSKASVLLLSMPFGPLFSPSIGLSLLKASLCGTATEILYFTLDYAKRIGPQFYEWVSDGNPETTSLLGEWIFSGALFPAGPRNWAFLEEVLATPSFDEPVPDLERRIRAARAGTAEFLDDCVTTVLGHSPEIVGFTSVFQQQIASLALAKRIKKESPGIFVVFGGSNCEGVMGLTVLEQFEFVDAVVSGEGERSFPILVQRIRDHVSISDVPGVYTRERENRAVTNRAAVNGLPSEQMDALPYVEYEDYFEQLGAADVELSRSPILPFETSRGCWWGEKHHCSFCGLNGSSMAFRSKSADRALDELLGLARKHPTCPIMVVDNILDMNYLRTLLPKLAELRLHLNLFYEVKSNLKREQVRLLRDAGIREIQPGIESFSDRVLELMRKGVKGVQNLQLLKWCKQFGVWPHWNLLWGFPGEPPEDYHRMAEWIPLLVHLPPPKKSGRIRLDRFSPNFERSHELGFTRVRPYDSYGAIYPFEKDVVHDLAYYFEFEYAHDTNVAAYTRELTVRIAAWHQAYQRSELLYVDKGDQVVVLDSRPGAQSFVTSLRGVQRELFLACNEICPRIRLETLLDREDASMVLERELAPLLIKRFVLEDRGTFLNLAIDSSSVR